MPGAMIRLAAAAAALAVARAPPPDTNCPILFVGSSSIAFWWTLQRDMAPYKVADRGVPGARIPDVSGGFPGAARSLHPRAVVLYAGDNDIDAGRPADRVLHDFGVFLEVKDRTLGAAPVYFISIKPSRARASELPTQTAVNDGVRALAATRHDLVYIDVASQMLQDGRARNLFIFDGLHMNAAGYALWTRAVRAALDQTGAADLPCPP